MHLMKSDVAEAFYNQLSLICLLRICSCACMTSNSISNAGALVQEETWTYGSYNTAYQYYTYLLTLCE